MANSLSVRDDGLMYDAERLAAIAWSYIGAGNDPRVYAVVNAYGYLEALRLLCEGDTRVTDIAGESASVWLKHVQRTGIERSDLVEDHLSGSDFACLQRCAYQKLGVSVVIPSDDFWPEQINDLGEHTPIALWVRGTVQSMTTAFGHDGRAALAFVGSRAATGKGVRTTTDFAYECAHRYVIASGGAFGIDAAAHKGALLANGCTVVFSAAGIDRVYPASHQELFSEIWRGGGVVISEYPLGAAPHAYRFLQRNRLIAAYSRATVVVEAPIRSGALSTARHALAIGRPVGAVPGSIDSQYSVGCHELIRNGGMLVANVQHIHELMCPIGEQLQIPFSDTDGGERTYSGDAVTDFFSPPPSGISERGVRVLDAVPKVRAAALESIADIAGVSVDSARVELGKLALLGYVKQCNGLWVKARAKR